MTLKRSADRPAAPFCCGREMIEKFVGPDADEALERFLERHVQRERFFPSPGHASRSRRGVSPLDRRERSRVR